MSVISVSSNITLRFLGGLLPLFFPKKRVNKYNNANRPNAPAPNCKAKGEVSKLNQSSSEVSVAEAVAASIGATATGLAGSTVGVSMGFGGSTTGAVVFTGGWLGAVALCIAAVAGETGVAAVGVAGVFSARTTVLLSLMLVT